MTTARRLPAVLCAAAANRPPDAVDDEFRIRPGGTVRANVLSNDFDPDGDALTVRPETGRTSDGTFEVGVDGTFTYTPRRGFVGRDGVGYTISDGRGGSDIGTVWIYVENAYPVVEDEYFAIRPGETLRGNLLSNDVDPDGDVISAFSRLDVKRDGSSPTRRYSASSARSSSSTRSRTNLASEQSAESPSTWRTGRRLRPTTASGFATTSLRVATSLPMPATRTATRFACTPSAWWQTARPRRAVCSGSTPTAASATSPPLASSAATASPTRSSTATGLPRPGFVGAESFDYTVSDGRGGSDVGTVDIYVVNRPPVAVDDNFETSPGHALSAGLLGNDSDRDGDALWIGTGTIRTAAGGQVTFYRDGLFYYRTPAGFVGVDSFEYGLLDSYGAQDVGKVTITVGVLGNGGRG